MDNTPVNKLGLMGVGMMLISTGAVALQTALQASPIVINNVIGSGIVVAVGLGVLWAREQIKIPKDGEN